ncbi:MAG: polysaccharide lyase family 7 protein [Planctomycetota bacterium]|nr:polysaccharide lyase family 7 protein [Planctomycetota bacterium]
MDHWKLTVPIKGQGKGPLEISPKDLVAGFELEPYFLRGTELVFRCPVEGYTTSASSYPRSELRERVDPKSDKKNWDGHGRYILSASCQVVAFPPKKPHIIVGQIHGYKSQPLVKLRWTNGELQALVKDKPSSNKETKYFFGRVGGQFFNYQIKVNKGILELTVNGKTVTHAFFVRNGSETGWRKERFYFKAGAYVNSNLNYDSKGSYGEVHFKALKVVNPDY